MSTCYNPFTLEGKTILVTGASSGIGKQIAIDCSKMGAKVIITARNEERLKETFANLDGAGHMLYVADLNDDEQLESLVAAIPEIDGAALCAGKGLTCPVLFSTSEKMKDIFNVNFFATAELLRMLYKSKKAKKYSSIVIIDSIGGVTRFTPGNASYGATKAALNSYTKFCAREYAPRKIRVNCICPGMVETPLIHSGRITQEQLDADAKKHPCGRHGKPTDVSYGAVYLLSDASSWVTGTNLFIDGGISIV